jgi:chromosome segregation ATPase
MEQKSTSAQETKNYSWFGWSFFLILGLLIGRGLNSPPVEFSDNKEPKSISKEDLKAFYRWQKNLEQQSQLKEELINIQEMINEQKGIFLELENTNNNFRSDLENVQTETKTIQDEISYLVQNKEEHMREAESLSQNIQQLNRELEELINNKTALENELSESSN